MKRRASWTGVAAVVAAALALGMRTSGEPLSPAGQADAIAADLRCPVCQGLSVRDSDSTTARDIRADIEGRLAGGESPPQIRQAYVDRYGEWILLRPRTSGFQALVWILPAAFSSAGAVGLFAVFWRWRRSSRTRRPTEAERDLVAVALAGIGAHPANPAP